MQTVQPLIDQFGNINLHMEEDLVLPLRGGEGLADLSQRDLVFRIPARSITHVVQLDPAEPTGRLIRLTAKELRSVRSGDTFILLDTTGGGAASRWEGVIRRRA